MTNYWTPDQMEPAARAAFDASLHRGRVSGAFEYLAFATEELADATARWRSNGADINDRQEVDTLAGRVSEAAANTIGFASI